MYDLSVIYKKKEKIKQIIKQFIMYNYFTHLNQYL